MADQLSRLKFARPWPELWFVLWEVGRTGVRGKGGGGITAVALCFRCSPSVCCFDKFKTSFVVLEGCLLTDEVEEDEDEGCCWERLPSQFASSVERWLDIAAATSCVSVHVHAKFDWCSYATPLDGDLNLSGSWAKLRSPPRLALFRQTSLPIFFRKTSPQSPRDQDVCSPCATMARSS